MKRNANFIINERQFEETVSHILEYVGYSCKHTSVTHDSYDICATNKAQSLLIDVKQSLTLNASISSASLVRNLLRLQKYTNDIKDIVEIPTLILGFLCPKSVIELINRHPLICFKFIVLDVSNLLFLIQNNSTLHQELLSCLAYSVDDVPLEAPPDTFDYNLPSLKKDGLNSSWKLEQYINKLKNWCSKDERSSAYEELCTDILKLLFSEDLSLWITQKSTDSSLFRFDLICKIKSNTNKDFWKTAEQFYNTKYIVFEFKNYTEKITQKEIFTTVKYLYSAALRRIAIMISPLGADNNASKAISGCLREDGKLILVLTNEDMINMLQHKLAGESPDDYLSQKLDLLLIGLEK